MAMYHTFGGQEATGMISGAVGASSYGSPAIQSFWTMPQPGDRDRTERVAPLLTLKGWLGLGPLLVDRCCPC